MMDYDLGLEVPPKSRENTYRQEALEQWLSGLRDNVVFWGARSRKFLRMEPIDGNFVVG
ncbi:Uncharacterised protein [Mycobacteroides abscessus subsp. massiliense]|nr:Uncharacterised protein [Mycobacteroides abscessus subsp. massiliense]